MPGSTSPISVTVTRPSRVDEPTPAAAARTTPRTASGRRTAARSATVPPSEWPTHTALPIPSASAIAKTQSAKPSRCAASGNAPECPCPGRSGTRTRCFRASSGAIRAPVLDRPTQPVHEHDRRPGTCNRITKPRAVHDELALIEFVKTMFALRPHQGIFFAQWMFCRSRPSEACSPYNRGYELTRSAVCAAGFFVPGEE